MVVWTSIVSRRGLLPQQRWSCQRVVVALRGGEITASRRMRVSAVVAPVRRGLLVCFLLLLLFDQNRSVVVVKSKPEHLPATSWPLPQTRLTVGLGALAATWAPRFFLYESQKKFGALAGFSRAENQCWCRALGRPPTIVF